LNVARIEGVDLPRQKTVWIALTYIYGVGQTTARKIVELAGVNGGKRVHELTDHEIARIREVIQENFRVEGELRKQVAMNIKRLIDLNSYRGLRHRRGLPVRGQRTHTNARTRKGPRRLAAKRPTKA
jgi:small subunit ribosomal protein S13